MRLFVALVESSFLISAFTSSIFEIWKVNLVVQFLDIIWTLGSFWYLLIAFYWNYVETWRLKLGNILSKYSRKISAIILLSVTTSEACLELSWHPRQSFFRKTVKAWKQLTIFAKSYIVGIRMGSKYASGCFLVMKYFQNYLLCPSKKF